MTPLYEVRDGEGTDRNFIGTYRARTPAQAVQRAKDEQAAYQSVFRRSASRLDMNNWRAVEIKTA